jgi:putative peptide zinc metalloprotease protein
MKLHHHSKVTLHPLTIRKDRKNYIVEDIHSGDFFEMPEVCIHGIELINEGMDLQSIEEVLKKVFPNEDVDMQGFVSDLLDLGIVHTVDGVEVPRKSAKAAENASLAWIPEKAGKLFFNRGASVIYLAAILASAGILMLRPELFPVYKDIFVFELMMYNILVFLSLTFLLVVLHEMGHVLAMRAEGLPTGINLGHRLFFIVLETDMSRVWTVPPGKRYRLYLAGLSFDAVVLFAALLVQLLFRDHALAAGMARMAAFSTFIRILYQCCVYMKTDLYYVLENLSGSYNLMENGQNYLRKWLPFLPEVKTSMAFAGEEKLVRPYAVFYLAGIVITVAVLAFYNIPLIVHAAVLVMPGFLEPAGSILFWDAVIFYLQFVIMFGLLGFSWFKKYRLKD